MQGHLVVYGLRCFINTGKGEILLINLKNNMGRGYFIIIGSIALLAIFLVVLSPFVISRRSNVDDILVIISHDEEPFTVLVETLNDNISLAERLQIDIQNNICYITPKIKNKSFFSNSSNQGYELDIDMAKIDTVYLKYRNNETQLLWNKEIN